MASRARLGLGVLVLSIAPLAVLDCFNSSAGNPGPDASFDSTGFVDGFGSEAGDDAVAEGSASEAATDTGSPPVDSGVPEAQVADAEAGPPVLEVIGQNLYAPIAMAVDSQFIYFLESALPPDAGTNYTGGIRRCPLAGCGSGGPTVVVPGAVIPGGMALSGTSLFWSDSFQYILTCDVSTVPCTGTQFVDILDTQGDAGDPTFPTQLWVNGTHLYWFVELNNDSDRAILTCPVTGCAATAGYPKTVLYAGPGTTLYQANTSGLAIDGSFAYVSLFSGGPILRYAMTSAETADITTETQLGGATATPGAAHDLDLDGTWLRWADSNGTTVSGCQTPGCNPIVDIATGRVMPYATRHDASYVYGVDQGPGMGTGVLWRLHK